MKELLLFSELVAVKICHDLAGPVGAFNNGVELLGDPDEDLRQQALALVGDTAEQAVTRLRFFRVAFGTENIQQAKDISDIKKICEDFFRIKNIRIDWGEEKGQLYLSTQLKLVFNLFLLMADMLVYGGKITLDLQKNSMMVQASGQGIHLDTKVRGIFDGQKEEMIIKYVQAYLVCFLIEKQHFIVDIEQGDETVILRITQ